MWLMHSLFLCGFVFVGDAYEEGKIIGGEPVEIKDVPYQVSFRYNDRHFCGGSIFNKEHIVTAAHCVSEFESVENLTVVVGQTKLDDTTGQTVDVAEMTPHPKYDSQTIDYDVAVLKLAKPLDFNDNVAPIELSTTPVRYTNVGLVSGWGTTTGGGGGVVSNQLLAIQARAQPYYACQLQYYFQLTGRMFCAGNFFGGTDSCQGDSGGPFNYKNKLAGIVSFGRGCGDLAAPGVYTDVSTVLSFIRNVTGSSN